MMSELYFSVYAMARVPPSLLLVRSVVSLERRHLCRLCDLLHIYQATLTQVVSS